MNKYIPITFIILFSTTVLKQYLPYVDYSINQEYISSVLCENLDKPQLECDGKCYLKKQLKKVNEEKDNTNQSQQKSITESDVYSISTFALQIPTSFLHLKERLKNNNSKWHSSFSNEPQVPPPECNIG